MASAFDAEFDRNIAALTAAGTPFEVQEESLGGVRLRTFRHAPPTLAGLFGLARQHAAREFIVYEGERYTFGETLARANALAAHLQREHGIGRGDRVVIAMRNYPEWIFAFMAIAIAGAVAVPLNAWWQAEELGYALADSGARLAIADAERAARLARVGHVIRPPVLVVRGDGADFPGMQPLPDAVLESGALPAPVDLAAGDDVSILYTSGSTGHPKGAVSTQRAMVSGVLNYAAAGAAMLQIQLREAAERGEAVDPANLPQPVALLTVPLFHITGLLPIWLVCFVSGRKLVMMHKWDVDLALRLIEAERVTYFTGVPTMSLELLQSPNRARHDLSSLIDLGAGGAPRPAEHVARLREAFPASNPGIGYGLTETNGVGAINSRESYRLKPASTGRATQPLVEIGIQDDAGNALPVDAIGEVCIRSVANVRGYWNKPEATRAAFGADGWFRTGDLGRLDAEGYLFIVDRKKDIIIRGGENISCQEVEAAIYGHPAIAEACVFGLPDERLGEIVAAVVHLHAAGTDLDADTLRDHLAAHIAGFKIPARIWFSLEPLARLGSGKIDKVALRNRFRALAAGT